MGDGAVAVVGGGGMEEVVLCEEAGALEFFDSLVDQFLLVNDAKGEGANESNHQEEDAKEQEEAEDVNVPLGTIGSLLV